MKFLSSHGAQLVTADVDGLIAPENLLDVFTHCSNLSIEHVTVYGMEQWEFVRIFGLRIRNLIVSMETCTGEEWHNAISICINLPELRCCWPCSWEHERETIDNIVMKILSSLASTALKIVDLYEFNATQRSIAMIGSATSNLKELRLHLTY